MNPEIKFQYKVTDPELEKASNSYVMSLMAVMVGLPMPIVNLLATLFFYIGNRKQTYFVRWHCMQALLSQASVLIVNSYGFWWSVSIIFTEATISNRYIAFMITAFIFNLTEIILTIYTAVKTRKGEHINWWFYGGLTDLICRK